MILSAGVNGANRFADFGDYDDAGGILGHFTPSSTHVLTGEVHQCHSNAFLGYTWSGGPGFSFADPHSLATEVTWTAVDASAWATNFLSLVTSYEGGYSLTNVVTACVGPEHCRRRHVRTFSSSMTTGGYAVNVSLIGTNGVSGAVTLECNGADSCAMGDCPHRPSTSEQLIANAKLGPDVLPTGATAGEIAVVELAVVTMLDIAGEALGTMALDGRLTVNGGWTVDLDESGGCDQLTGTGTLDLSQATIALREPARFQGGSRQLAAVGEVVGAGNARVANLPGSRLVADEGRLVLVHDGAYLILW